MDPFHVGYCVMINCIGYNSSKLSKIGTDSWISCCILWIHRSDNDIWVYIHEPGVYIAYVVGLSRLF